MFDLSTGTSWAKIGGIMSDEHNIVVGDLEIELISIQADINDDDEDILIVVTAITNESPTPQGDLDVYIETNSGSKCYSKEGITSLGPGLQRNWSFEFVLMSGNWSFHLKSNQGKGSMGPFSFDFEYNAQRKRNLKNSIGSSLFSGAFDMSLGDFGQVRERELIDSSNVAMTSYSAENVTGGGTKILVNEESVREDMMQSTDQVGETNIASDEDQTTEHSNNDVLLTNLINGYSTTKSSRSPAQWTASNSASNSASKSSRSPAQWTASNSASKSSRVRPVGRLQLHQQVRLAGHLQLHQQVRPVGRLQLHQQVRPVDRLQQAHLVSHLKSKSHLDKFWSAKYGTKNNLSWNR